MMSLTGKNRKQITDLRQSVQLSELNRQLDWMWQQLLGGLSIKSMDSSIQEALSQSAQQIEKVSWIIVGGENADTMVLSAQFMRAIATDINTNGRIAIGGMNDDLAGLYEQLDGQTVIKGERIPMLVELEKRVKTLEENGGETDT